MTSPADAAGAPAPARSRSLARSGLVTMVGAGAGAALGFALTLVVARVLGATGSGLLFTATAAFGVAGVAGRMGADTALVREVAALVALGRSGDVRRTVALAVAPVVLVTSAVAAVVWLAAGPVAGALLGEASASGVRVLRVLALVLPFAAVSMALVGASRGLGDVLPMVLVEQAGKPLLRVVAGLAVGVLGWGLLAMTWAWAVPVVVGCLLALVLLVRALPSGRAAADGPAPWRQLALPFWRFALPRGAAGTVEALSAAVAVLLVSVLAGAAQAGVMAGVLRYALVGTLALQAVRLVVAPQLSAQLATGDAAGAQELHRWSTWAVLALSGPAYACLAVYAAPALSLLGPDFRAGAPALAILCAAMLVNVATGNVQAVLLMSGRSGTNLVVVLVGLAVHVALAAALVPVLGVTGAAVAAGTVVVLENLLYLRSVRRALGIRTLTAPVSRLLAAVVISFAVPGALALVLLGTSWPAVLLHAAVSLPAYGAYLLRHREDVPVHQLTRALRTRAHTGRGVTRP